MPQRPYLFYMRRHWQLITLGLLALVVTNALDAISPWYLGKAIDQITNAQPMAEITKTALLLVGISLGLAGARFLWRFFWMQFHHSVADDLRQRIFTQLTRLGPTFYQGQSTGDLMSLINNDVNTFRMSIGPGVLILVDGLLLMMFIPALMWKISPTWTVTCIILLPLVPFVSLYMIRRSKAAYDEKQCSYARMSGFVQELVAGLRVIKAYAQEKNQLRLFSGPSESYREACNRADRMDATFGPVLELFAAMGAVILLFIGAKDLVAGVVSVGSFFAFFQYIQRMVWPLEAIGVAFGHFQNGNSAYRRIQALLETPSDLPAGGTATLDSFRELEVRGLNFSYPAADLPGLRNINFNLRSGEIVGVVGLTGSGKSTLVDVVAQLYRPSGGSILINGDNVSRLNRTAFRHLLTVASQEPFLFSRSVADNILLGRPGWRWEDVRWATELVQIDQEISALPKGHNTLLGERGVNLSGGQRQRLALARALVRRSSITIIDDSLSAVDARTEAQILSGLRLELRRSQDRAALIVSHRLSALRWADRILVLKEGQIEAQGTAQELEKISPTFQRLMSLQERGDGSIAPSDLKAIHAESAT